MKLLSNRFILFVTILFLIVTFYLAARISYYTYVKYIWPLLLLYLGIIFLRYFFYFVGVVANEFRTLVKQELPESTTGVLAVSIIVPAYNEEKVIRDSLISLMGLNYSHFEIIVVDDGSQDNTFQEAEAVKMEHPAINITVVKKLNGGKASALNVGIQHSSGAIILCVDADSKVHPDSLIMATKHFENPQIMAVAGFVEIINQNSFLLKCQQLEYVISLNFIRSAYSILGIVPIVPGPAGLFRRNTLVTLKGYTSEKNNFAEDAELSLRILASGGKIVSEPTLIAYTEAPDTWGTLLRQRYRWNRGTFQAIRSHFVSLICAKRFITKMLGLQLILETWIVPIFNLSLVIIFVAMWLRFQVGSFFTIWMGMLISIEVLVTLVGLSRSKYIMKGIILSLCSRMSYDMILLFWKVLCLFDEWLNKEMTWDKLNRIGSLKKKSN